MSEIQNFPIADIDINKRFRKEDGDIAGLAQSIKENGLYHPIGISPAHTLVFGARRLKAFQKLGLKEIPARIISVGDIMHAELEENFRRKDFTPLEWLEIKKYFEPHLKEAAQARIYAGKKPPTNLVKGRVNEIIAKYIGISHATLEKTEKIYEATQNHPEIFKQVTNWFQRANSRGIDRMFTRVKMELTRIDPPKVLSRGKTEIRICNMGAEKAAKLYLKPESVDFILTDPLFAIKHIQDWELLARLGQDYLKPGSFLATYASNLFLTEEIKRLSERLEYFFLIAVYFQNVIEGKGHRGGSTRRVFTRRIIPTWRPTLIYFKPPYSPPSHYIIDSIISDKQNKSYHIYGESIAPFLRLLDDFSRPGDLIFEPFAGGGTTIEACALKGRNCFATEIEPKTFEIIKKRFPDAEVLLP